MVDESLILRKIGEMDVYLGQINEFQNISLDEYCADWKIQRIVERTLQMMIESCVDIGGHIISDLHLRLPKTYGDTFLSLEEAGIIGNELCKTMQQMAKFRNIVVHSYDKIDAEIVIGILRKRLGDFSQFKNAILHYLKTGNR